MQVSREGGGALFRVVLFRPQIPQNAGNVARTCAATGTPLHLVEPLGFSLEDRYLKRAGLDYWPHVRLSVHPGFDAFRGAVPGGRLVYFSAGGGAMLHDFRFAPEDALVFGPENPGLPPVLPKEHPGELVRIPCDRSRVRSLNLSTAVGIALFEALRQAAEIRGWWFDRPAPGAPAPEPKNTP